MAENNKVIGEITRLLRPLDVFETTMRLAAPTERELRAAAEEIRVQARLHMVDQLAGVFAEAKVAGIKPEEIKADVDGLLSVLMED